MFTIKKYILLIVAILSLCSVSFAGPWGTGGGTGSGDVAKVGTPANGEIGQWTGDGTIAGTGTPTLGIPDSGTLTNCTGLPQSGVLGLGPGSTPTPYLLLNDSDAAGADDADEMSGAIRSNMTTTTEDAETSDDWWTFMLSGTETTAILIDGSDNQIEMKIVVDFEGGTKSPTPVTGDADDFAANFTGANLYGGTYIANGTGTAQLPAMLPGMNFTIITLGAIAVIVDTNANDGYLHNGVTGTEGANLTNTSAAGDMITVEYYTADDWLITSDGWTPE